MHLAKCNIFKITSYRLPGLDLAQFKTPPPLILWSRPSAGRFPTLAVRSRITLGSSPQTSGLSRQGWANLSATAQSLSRPRLVIGIDRVANWSTTLPLCRWHYRGWSFVCSAGARSGKAAHIIIALIEAMPDLLAPIRCIAIKSRPRPLGLGALGHRPLDLDQSLLLGSL